MHLCLKTMIFYKKMIIFSVFVKFLLPYVLHNRFCIISMVFLKFLICTLHFYITCFRMVLIENLSQEGIIQKIICESYLLNLIFLETSLTFSGGDILFKLFLFDTLAQKPEGQRRGRRLPPCRAYPKRGPPYAGLFPPETSEQSPESLKGYLPWSFVTAKH